MIELKLMLMPILTLQEKSKQSQMLTLMMPLLFQKTPQVLALKAQDSVQLEFQELKVISQDKLKKLHHLVLKEGTTRDNEIVNYEFSKN